MKDYWNALGYINTVQTMDHPAIANLAQKSDPDKWQSEVLLSSVVVLFLYL